MPFAATTPKPVTTTCRLFIFRTIDHFGIASAFSSFDGLCQRAPPDATRTIAVTWNGYSATLTKLQQQ